MKKILFTMTPAFNPNDGGVQRTTYKLGKHFTEHGYEVFYYSMANKGHVEAEYGTLFFSEFEGEAENVKNIEHLESAIHEIKPDIVINQMPYVEALTLALHRNKKRLNYALLGCLRNSLFNFKDNIKDRLKAVVPTAIGKKLMVNPLTISLTEQIHKRKHSKQLRFILDKHDYFILLAPPNKIELEYFVGKYKEEKVSVIPNSIPDTVSEIGQRDNIILHVGRLNIAQKRSDLLVDFWEECHSKVPDWKFVIVGDGPYFQTLKERVEELKLPRVELVGYQEPEPYYKKASIFMMTSAFEGFPNVLLEAQSYGLTSVLFNSYLALESVVKDGEDSFLIKPFDTKEMSEKVELLVQNEELRTTMQNKSLENAKKYTIDAVGEYWFDFFKKL